MSKNVSDQIVEILTDVGVSHIFGIPGDTIDSLMESLRKQDKLQFILMRHEEAGAFAACAQAKLSGELAVCVACQGPGAVHLLNGMYDAALDRVPMLAITGQVDSSLIGTHTVQEIDQMSLFEDATVYNQEVRSAENLPEVLTLAIQTAITRRGAAHISIPSDVMRDKAIKWMKHNPVFDMHYDLQPAYEKLAEVAKMINQAKRVAILYGNGVRQAGSQLINFAEKIKAPLVHTTRSKDIINNMHELYVGGIGLMGSESGNHAINYCDLLLVIGSSFAFAEFYPDNVPIIQIDIDPTRLGMRVPVALSVVSDAVMALEHLHGLVETKSEDKFLRQAQERHKKSLHNSEKRAKKSPPDKPLHPQTLTQQIMRYANDDAIFCADSGTVSVWANNYLHLNSQQRYLWSWNLATLGVGMTYAIGAQLLHPNRQVIALCGDGGFEMMLGDFATLMKYQLPVIIFVYNNSCYHYIELEEQAEGNPIFGTKFSNPNFAKLAEAYGAIGLRIDNYSQLDTVLAKAFAQTKPVIVDAHIDPNELLVPPKVTAKMVTAFAKSTIKSYFA